MDDISTHLLHTYIFYGDMDGYCTTTSSSVNLFMLLAAVLVMIPSNRM